MEPHSVSDELQAGRPGSILGECAHLLSATKSKNSAQHTHM
jgi:hypothetical protein